MSQSIQTVSEKLVYQSPRFSLYEEKYALPDGREATHLTLRHPGAVVIIPQTESGNLLMVRQYRHSVRRQILEFPAGTLEKGEAAQGCAEREIREEVGHAARSWVDLGTLLPTPGFCDEVQYLFLARDLYPEKLPGDDDELINVEQFSIAEVERMISSGEIIDGKTIAIFCRARIKKIL